VAVFIPKAWAIIWDPLVGAWSDRTRSRFGRRRPFLIAGAIGVPLAFIALFAAPALPVTASFIWVTATYFALASLYSLFAVPYVAIPAEIGATKESRARLVSARMLIVMIGILAGAGLAPLLVAARGGGRSGYTDMALLIAALCFVAMLLPLAMLRGRDPQAAGRSNAPKLWRSLLSPLVHVRFRRLVASYVLQLAAAGIFSASAPYLITRALGRDAGDTGIAMIAMIGATTLAVPLWSWAARRIDETRVLYAAMIIFAITGIGLAAAASFATWSGTLVLYALAGIAFGGIQLLPYTMVAHMVHAQASDGSSGEASFMGVWTAAEKLGLAIAPALTGLCLALAGDDVKRLLLFVAFTPALLLLAAIAVLAIPYRSGTLLTEP
jgi:Na+/melibiose symporter-like transporter